MDGIEVSLLSSATEVTLLQICVSNILGCLTMNQIASKERLSLHRCEKYVSRDIETLRLPNVLKNILVTSALTEGVLPRLIMWHDMNPKLRRRPYMRHALNWRGHVDQLRMAKWIVEDESQRPILRYLLACAYCHEMHISKLMKLLSNADIDRICRRNRSTIAFLLARLWWEALDNLAECRSSEELLYSLDHDLLASLLNDAVRSNYDIAMAYLDKIPLELARQIVWRKFVRNDYTLCHIFIQRRMLAIFPELEQKGVLKSIDEYALMLQLNRPNHEAFLQLTRGVLRRITCERYHCILERVVEIAESMQDDSSYVDLLFNFVKLGATYKYAYYSHADEVFFEDPIIESLFKRIHHVLAFKDGFFTLKNTFRNLFS